MNPESKKHFQEGLQSAAWSLVVTFGTVIILIFLAHGLKEIPFPGEEYGEEAAYIIYFLVIGIACYLLCRKNPSGFWFIPVICNLSGIISAIVESKSWTSYVWIFMISGWGFSIVMGLLGTWRSRKRKQRLSDAK